MEKLRAEAGAERLVGFVPTGWLHELARGMERGEFPVRHSESSTCEVHLVPYSEHSSYGELQEFVRWLRPHEVVPTVGLFDRAGDTKEGERARAAMLSCFRNLVDETAAKKAFIRQQFGSAGDDDWGGIVEPMPQLPPPAADARVAELRALAGDALSESRAGALLRAAGGDVNKAANAFLDGGGGGGGGSPRVEGKGPDGSGAKRPRSSGGGQASIASFFKKPAPAAAKDEAPLPRRLREEAVAVPPSHAPLPSAAASPAKLPPAEQAGSAEAQLAAASRVALPCADFVPDEHACWAEGTDAPYMHVAAACAAATSTRSRITIAAILVNTFRALMARDAAALLPALYLICGRCAAEHEGGAELGVGGAAVPDALLESGGDIFVVPVGMRDPVKWAEGVSRLSNYTVVLPLVAIQPGALILGLDTPDHSPVAWTNPTLRPHSIYQYVNHGTYILVVAFQEDCPPTLTSSTPEEELFLYVVNSAYHAMCHASGITLATPMALWFPKEKCLVDLTTAVDEGAKAQSTFVLTTKNKDMVLLYT